MLTVLEQLVRIIQRGGDLMAFSMVAMLGMGMLAIAVILLVIALVNR